MSPAWGQNALAGGLDQVILRIQSSLSCDSENFSPFRVGAAAVPQSLGATMDGWHVASQDSCVTVTHCPSLFWDDISIVGAAMGKVCL